MSKDYLGPVTRALVGVFQDRLPLVADIANRLGDEKNGDKWHRKLSACLQEGLLELEPESGPTPLLEFLGTVSTPSTTSLFIAKDRFVINTKPKAKVRISALGTNFCKFFLEKKEAATGKQTLRYHILRRVLTNILIIKELGDEAKAETLLCELYSLMEKQGNGEYGVLLNNGHANIFYIRDQNGVLRAVDANWYDGGWYVDAYSVKCPSRWDEGYRVFSRKPFATVSV